MTSKTQKPVGLYTFRFESEGQHNNTTTIFSFSCSSPPITRGFPPHFQATPPLSLLLSSGPRLLPRLGPHAVAGLRHLAIISRFIVGIIASLCIRMPHWPVSETGGYLSKKVDAKHLLGAFSAPPHSCYFFCWVNRLAGVYFSRCGAGQDETTGTSRRGRTPKTCTILDHGGRELGRNSKVETINTDGRGPTTLLNCFAVSVLCVLIAFGQ